MTICESRAEVKPSCRIEKLNFLWLWERFGTLQLGSRTTVIGSQIAREESIGVAVNGRYSIDVIGCRFDIG
jgi:hypothetical protein